MKKPDYQNPVGFLPLIGFLLLICLYFVIHKPFDGGLIFRAGMSLWALLIAFMLCALAGGTGGWILSLVKFNKYSSHNAFALGLGFLSLIIFIIGSILGIHAWWVWIFFVLMIIFLFKNIWGWVKDVYTESMDVWRTSKPFGKVIGWISLVILISTLIIALAPPLKFDALVYHLALPQEYIANGSLAYLPGNMFWGMPQLGEMLFTWSMVLAGERAAVCLGWMVGVISLGWLLHFTSRKFSTTTGWVTVSALLSGYTFASSLSWGYIDWFTILFGSGVLIILNQWVEMGNRKDLILAGIMAGFCLGCKYTAGAIIPAAMTAIIWRLVVKNKRNEIKSGIFLVFSRLRSLFIFGSTVVIITIPWWVKNSIATGNPFYPFFFPSGVMDGFRLDFYQIPASSSFWETFLLPFSATFLGVEGATGYSASIGPLLLGLGLFAWLPQSIQTKNQKHTTHLCLVVAFSGLLIWMIGSRFTDFLNQSRVYFSIFPAFAILSGLGFNGFEQLRPFGIRMQNIIGALVVLCLSFTALEVSTYTIKTGSLNYLSNLITEDDYLGENLGWYYPALDHIADVNIDINVLMLFETRGFYCQPYCDSDEILDQWKHDLFIYNNYSEVLKAWKAQGYTHLLFNKFGANYVEVNDVRYRTEDWMQLEELLSGLPAPQNFGDAYYLYSLTP